MKKSSFIFIFLCLFSQIKAEAFEKVVIWGHKLHSHTHSYIHNAFYRAFLAMNYSTYWFDDQDDISNFDFSNCLFLTEGQVDSKIPIRDDALYLLHNPSLQKYDQLRKNQWITFQVYTNDVLSRPSAVKVDTCIYEDLANRCLYMPWATDLLPHEIETSKKIAKIAFAKNRGNPKKKAVYWIGTIGGGYFGNIEKINPFKKACIENKISFIQKEHVSIEENKILISNSYIAPTIVGTWQEEKGYIPCRIFKNISYGKMGVTNSETVYELLERKVIYNPDTYQLFYDAKKKLNSMHVNELLELMDLVKEKHTYINRIQKLLEFLGKANETH